MMAISELSVLLPMSQSQSEDLVMLQVKVRESIRDHLKVQSVVLKESMGDLADRLLDEALARLESQATAKRKK